MSNYRYVKKNSSFKKVHKKLIGFISILIGLLMLLYFFFPIISYQFFLSPYTLAQGKIEVPIPKHLVFNGNSISSLFSQRISSLTSDYSDARNWYPQVEGSVNKIDLEEYKLSIPKLKIKEASVSTIDYDLSKHLVQYFGTSVPPKNGSAVIYGHSSLPQLFDPSNYKTIFATLHTLKLGDEIVLNLQGIIYTYKVISINVTSPEDTSIFTQQYDNSYIVLVTCTPPGTTWKRLIIKASLASLE